MFFSTARLRLLLASSLLLLPTCAAHTNIIFTSSVSYCAPPETLLVQKFDIAYTPANNSVTFNVSAASVEQNVNVSANILLNVYGRRPVNLTIDICSLFNGALCPLPVYNFVGAESLPLPSSLSITQYLPGIAYIIPDLEAFAQLTLTDIQTGELKACIQATLSNGWSTHQPGVAWATGGIGLLALASAMWHSFIPESLAPLRLLDLVSLYQIIASSSFLNLNYPVIFRAFTLNFSWAMGLFAQSPVSSLQRSINHMRNITGGTLPNGSGSSIALINRKLSPYNSPVSEVLVLPQRLVSAARLLPKVDLSDLANLGFIQPSVAINHTALVARDVQTVTTGGTNVLQAGIPIFVNTIGIATANAFMTTFLTALILLACTFVTIGIFFALVYVLSSREKCSEWLSEVRRRSPAVAQTWGFRMVLICSYPLVLFAFYQWTLHDSWLAIFISAVTFVALLVAIGYAVLRVLLFARKSSPYNLYIDLPCFEPLYGKYRVERYFFFTLPIAAIFLRALFTAFAHADGTVAIIAIVIIEGFLVLSLSVLRPARTRRADVLSIFIALVRLFCAGLCIGFLEQLQTAAIPRVVIGIIIAIMYSVAVVLMFLNTLWNLGLKRVYLRRAFSSLQSSQSPSSSHSMLEKNDIERDIVDKKVVVSAVQAVGSPADSVYNDRPGNPTPTHNMPLEPHVNQPYSTFTPTATFAEPPSASNTETSYGSQIPSRWRASYLWRDSRSSESEHSSPAAGMGHSAGRTQPSSPSHYNSGRQPAIEEEGTGYAR
ncbi:TRP-domain-containing protein [Dentipellis sp. KUC8613]|nr:TRP-domain-containing protein [Dentipellis sp. KUC8613]